MDTTSRAPNVSIDEFKRTKIVATIGPASNSYESILALIKAGANGLRLNFSHGDYEEREQQIKWIRKASKEYGKPVAIIQDLQGPKIRLGDFEGMVTVQAGQHLRFAAKADYESTGIIPVLYDLTKKVKKGHKLYLYDGKISAIATLVKDGVLYAEAQNDGVLIKRKGINLPDTDFEGDVIMAKDRKDLAWGSEHDIDYVAMSFIQTAQDIRNMRRLLRGYGSTASIIAKLETKASVENMEEIIQEADAVMVARGDLATETASESVPVVQRQIIILGMKYAKPTIVATQMLASMVDAPEPTRAEVSDVATAVFLGTDAVMLSDETANGKYPLESVKVMKRIILYTEGHNLTSQDIFDGDISRQAAISRAIIDLSAKIHAQAIVAETSSGATAMHISCRRPTIPVIVVTGSHHVAQKLTIAYGTKSYVRPVNKLAATQLTNWLRQQKVLSKGDIIVTASGKHPGVIGTTDTIKVRVLE